MAPTNNLGWFKPMHISTPAAKKADDDDEEIVRAHNRNPTAFATPSKFPSEQVSANSRDHAPPPKNDISQHQKTAELCSLQGRVKSKKTFFMSIYKYIPT